MIRLALRNILRRPLRSGLTVAGLTSAIAVLGCLTALEEGYRRDLSTELERMGVQLMLVPLGCPYDAAARVVRGKALDNTLPESVLDEARRDPAVAVAAPLFLAASPRTKENRMEMWAGLDQAALALKPWWRAKAGESWFRSDDSVILGCDAAEVEMREPGDRFYSPETGQSLRVAGVLERSGTSDDSLFFVPLQTAQRMFGQGGRLTAVAVRLRDPLLLREASERLQHIPGAQVVSMTEMMGVFVNLVGSVHTFLLAIALIALAVSILTIFNTLLAGVVERTGEFCILRALGASRIQVLRVVALEALLLSLFGSIAGVATILCAGQALESLAKEFMPLAPERSLIAANSTMLLQSGLIGAAAAIAGALYPAWRASKVQPGTALRGE